MSKLRIEERPFYSQVQMGGHVNGVPSHGQLAQMVVKAGAEALVLVTGGVSEVRSTNSTKERSTRVTCTDTRGLAAARIKVLRSSDKRSVFTDNVGGENGQRICSDETDVAQADPQQ